MINYKYIMRENLVQREKKLKKVRSKINSVQASIYIYIR